MHKHSRFGIVPLQNGATQFFYSHNTFTFSMGVLSGKDDILTSRYITALISDAEDRFHLVPIKVVIGDYFVTELNGGFYAFSLKNARILTKREVGTKPYQIIEYDTSHTHSLKANHLKELENVLRKNMLPRITMKQFGMLKMLGRKEKIEAITKARKLKRGVDDSEESIETYEFEPHDLKTLIDEIGSRADQFPAEAQNLINYIEELDIDYIVTPVRKVSEYLEDDFIATDPSFLGELLPRYQRLDNENRTITNKRVTGRKGYMMPVMVLMFVVLIGAVGFMGYEQGWFNSITSVFPDPDSISGIGDAFNPATLQGGTGNPYSDTALQAKYTPEELRIAVDNGEVPYDQLSPNMKKLVDSVELPKVTPNP